MVRLKKSITQKEPVNQGRKQPCGRAIKIGPSTPYGYTDEHLTPFGGLLALEKLLFQLIGVGFLLLTATLVTGVFFSEQLFGRALRFEHKTVFTIASWLVFAGLLGGRIVFGWRGRTALRWTFAGFMMLLLAYVGSRFVLEVVLGRV